MALLLTSSLSMAQLSPSAEGIRQKVADYAKENGITVSYDGDALMLQKDTMSFAMFFSGTSPVFVEMRTYDLNISECNVEYVSKAVNFINFQRCAIKAYVLPDHSAVRLSIESYVNDAQSVTSMLFTNMNAITTGWKICRSKYDEFMLNRDIVNQRLPFEIYSAEVINVDQADNVITEIYTDIESSDTQYITSQLIMNVFTDGEYEIGVKFITPDGKISTAETNPTTPYTFTAKLPLTSQQNFYLTGGWGSPNSGTWGPGNYMIEYYYKDKIFYAKKFTIH